MTYSEKLKDPRWQKKRLIILERDMWACQHCHSTEKTLHVHHLDYIKGKEPWDYPNEYFLTLCEDCHTETTEERKVLEDRLIKQFRLKFQNSFIQNCASEVFESYEDISNIFYILWELKEHKEPVVDILRELMNKKRTEFFRRKGEKTSMSCENCGDSVLLVGHSYLICSSCDWDGVLTKVENI